ncbi:hypothetical protein [Geodermatophilus sp. SYSU D01105]
MGAQLTITAPLDALTPARSPAHDASAGFAARGSVPARVGEVDGQPITAAHLRELLTQLDAICPGGLQAPAGGSLTVAITGPGGALLATTTHREAERLARRRCPTHPDADATTGDPGCGCPVLDRPPPTGAYPPTAAQRRWVTTRDRTCRHPGCANTAGWADLDHVLPHPAAAQPPARTCAACAGATTGSRPTPAAGSTPSPPRAS